MGVINSIIEKIGVPFDVGIAFVLLLPRLSLLLCSQIRKQKQSSISWKRKGKKERRMKERIGHTVIGRRDLARAVEDNKRMENMKTTKQEEEEFGRRGFFLIAIFKSNFGSQFTLSSEFGVCYFSICFSLFLPFSVNLLYYRGNFYLMEVDIND